MIPVFSIIIPLFNSEQSLAGNLQSISNQDFKDYEIVFVDGASTDNTLQLIADFQTLNGDIQIKLLSAPDKGIYDAMNKGIDLAEGQWLYFMGCDDRLHSPGVLSKVYLEIRKEDTDLIYGNVYGITSNTPYVYDTLSKVLSNGIHHQSIFYRSTLFTQLGKYNLSYKIAADYHFTLKVFLKEEYRKKYIDLDIAAYGESGLSSRNYDYTFYSYHYKLLANNRGIPKIEFPQKCLDTSVYCCLYLVREKTSMLFAWKNILYYMTGKNSYSFLYRIKTIARMLMWSLKPKGESPQV